MRDLVGCVIGLLLAPIVEARASLPVLPRDLSTPFQQRIAVRAPNAISVAWNTYKQQAKPCVYYGTSRWLLWRSACSKSSITYPTSRTWTNVVTLEKLAPATTYFYRVDSRNATVETFQSPRRAGDITPFNVSVVIDLGVYGEDGFVTQNRSEDNPEQPNFNHTTIARLLETKASYDMVLHPGDFAYADDWYLRIKNLFDGHNAYTAVLEQFFMQLAPVSATKPYMAGPGNHEADCQQIFPLVCPPGQTNFTDYINRFGRSMPEAFPSSSKDSKARLAAVTAKLLSNPPFWYSFEYGMVHFVFFSTETDFQGAPDEPGRPSGLHSGPFGRPGQQIEFLKADLSSVDRAVTPWVVVNGHRPWYSAGGKDNRCDECRQAFEDLFNVFGVDLAVFGHVHNSQRFLPVYADVADPKGMQDPMAPMYIVAGGAGNIEGPTRIGENFSYSAFGYADGYSYAKLNFMDAHHLGVDFMKSTTGEVLDSSVLYKSHKERFVGRNLP